YKNIANTGTHVGELRTGSGTLLLDINGNPASATFTGESATGWQEVRFAAPVAIAANTTYVVSYHAPNGHYSATRRYFKDAGVDPPPLHALAERVDGSNGLRAFNAPSPG